MGLVREIEVEREPNSSDGVEGLGLAHVLEVVAVAEEAMESLFCLSGFCSVL